MKTLNSFFRISSQKLVLFLFLLTFDKEIETKKILSVEFLGSKSHVLTYLTLLEEMSRKGYEVTIVAPCKGLVKEKGIREIHTIDFAQFTTDTNMSMFTLKEENQEFNPFTLFIETIPKYCENIYDLPEIQALVKETFDLIMLQPLLNDCSFGLIYRIMKNGKTPLVLFSPMSAPSMIVELTGGFHPSSFVSHGILNYNDDMTFTERFINTGTTFFYNLLFNWYYGPAMESIYRKKLGQDIPSIKTILGETSLILSNGHYSTSRPKPNLPDVIDVGGIHSIDAKPLPKELENFIAKGGEEGFILFSLGTAIKSDQMSDEKRQLFLNVFSRLKQQVIWKYDSNMTNVPENVLLASWLPQQDLLGHSKCRAFITHCGGGGTEESIYHAVPLLGLPFFGDQPINAKMAENLGYLFPLEWNDLTEDYLMSGIKEILTNPKYLNNVQKISREFKDQINKPLDRGVWWLEYVIRHKGASPLRSAARDLNYFQYHSLDVLAAYLLLILLPLWILWKTIGYALFLCGVTGVRSKKTPHLLKTKKQN